MVPNGPFWATRSLVYCFFPAPNKILACAPGCRRSDGWTSRRATSRSNRLLILSAHPRPCASRSCHPSAPLDRHNRPLRGRILNKKNQSHLNFHRAALKGTNLRGQTPICGFLRIPAVFCRFSAVSCENQRFSAKSCASQMLCFLGKGENLQESARISEYLRWGSVCPPRFVPLSAPRFQSRLKASISASSLRECNVLLLLRLSYALH